MMDALLVTFSSTRIEDSIFHYNPKAMIPFGSIVALVASGAVSTRVTVANGVAVTIATGRAAAVIGSVGTANNDTGIPVGVLSEPLPGWGEGLLLRAIGERTWGCGCGCDALVGSVNTRKGT